MLYWFDWLQIYDVDSGKIRDESKGIIATLLDKGHRVVVKVDSKLLKSEDQHRSLISIFEQSGIDVLSKRVFFEPENDEAEEETTLNLKWNLQDSEFIKKGWGYEVMFANEPEYCGKILHFEKNKKFSLHYHLDKKETWYIVQGRFQLTYIDTEQGFKMHRILYPGNVITNQRGMPHQLLSLDGGDVFEVSTHHRDSDSYRISKGD